jgi:hypothetical protein
MPATGGRGYKFLVGVGTDVGTVLDGTGVVGGDVVSVGSDEVGVGIDQDTGSCGRRPKRQETRTRLTMQESTRAMMM